MSFNSGAARTGKRQLPQRGVEFFKKILLVVSAEGVAHASEVLCYSGYPRGLEFYGEFRGVGPERTANICSTVPRAACTHHPPITPAVRRILYLVNCAILW